MATTSRKYQAKRRATVDDLYRAEGKAELVNGKLMLLMSTGGLPGRAALKIALYLHQYERHAENGRAFGDNVGFLVDLPNRRSFSPDAAFYLGEQIGMKFLEGAPVFAAEVRSEHDYGANAERAMAQKRADYFTAGTQVVWDVDLTGDDTIRAYRADAPNKPTIYRRGDAAEADPALPGFEMPVDDLFL